MQAKGIMNCVLRSPIKIGQRSIYSANAYDTTYTPKKVFKPMNEKPMRVLVTGAGGQIGYSILPRIARGDAFGFDTYVEIKMLDIPAVENIMHGVRMEIEDCAYKNLQKIEVTTDPYEAYANVDFVIMLANAMQLKPGVSRADLLKENLRVYQETASYLKSTAHKDLKILMIANPANSNALLLIESLKGVVPAKNITSLSRLDQNRARYMLAQKLGVKTIDVRKIIVWGNHSHTMVPDLQFAEVFYKESGWVNVSSVLKDEAWVDNVFIPQVKDRVNAIITARGKSSALSAANAGIDHINRWLNGTDYEYEWNSMGIYTDESTKYSCIPRGLVFSQPCICKKGEIRVASGLELNAKTQELLALSGKELLEERDTVLG